LNPKRRWSKRSEGGIDAANFPAQNRGMAKKASVKVEQVSSLSPKSEQNETGATPVLRSSTLLDTRVIYCGDNLDQLKKLPDGPSRTGQVWGETKEKRAFEDRHENTKAYIVKI
jgi:hypothetical protein